MRGVTGALAAAVLAVAAGVCFSLPAYAPAQSGELEAGVAVVDASWHVGASAGQYAGDCIEDQDGACTFVDHNDGTFDPTGDSIRRRPSYGIQSRLSVRAIVIDGPAPGAGDRMAILKNDQYIPQDLVYRRAGQIVESECPACGIGPENLTMASTHDHSSPMYSSTSWGVWAFQDVFDVRSYEYLARRMAEAVIAAAGDLRPVRVGAASSYYDKSHRHSFGPAIADDGTPAGYPQSDTDHDLTVIRFDDITNPGDPEPLINLVNFSQHPEFLEGNDLISADYVGPFERIMDRETGATTVYTQGAVGTSEPERSTYHSIHDRLEFSHRDYAQAEWGARLMANSAKDTFDDIAAGTPEDAEKYVPFDDDFDPGEIAMRDAWYPGPFSHPYPGVSNCRSDKGLAGDPQLPIIGLPDCSGVDDGVGTIADIFGVSTPDFMPIVDPGLTTDDFQEAGIPVPENYSAPGYTGLQEDIDVHLQAIRLGEILLPVCACEQWWDQSRNIELRTDKVVGNETLPGNLGYDWGAQCVPDGEGGTYLPDGTGTGEWRCPNPGNPAVMLPYDLSDLAVKRMRAQVNNDASGWNNAANAPSAESEPTNPTQIRGNYSHDDSVATAAYGYELTVPISMGNDYNGYIASYREYQRGDHYRKALTGWGPHSSDYMASRLATLGRALRGMPVGPITCLGCPDERPQDQKEEDLLAAKALADTSLNDQRATALGNTGGTAIAAYEAGLPDDGGSASAIAQPDDVERFSAAFFKWNGGSNFTDNPVVRVQQEVSPGVWQDYADQSGEIPVTLEFPTIEDEKAPYLQGNQEWPWTARFEAFVAGVEDQPINTGDREPATPAGNYRFVVDGFRREGGAPTPYHLESDPFEVKPWDDILVQDFKLEDDNTLSFVIGPNSTYQVTGAGFNGPGGNPISDQIGPIDYPDSHPDPAPFIRNQRGFIRDPAAPNDPDQLEWFCLRCSWRPWVDFGDADPGEVHVTITLGNGSTERVAATRAPGSSRFYTDASRPLRENESAQVLAGDVKDAFGNLNQPSNPIVNGTAPPDADGDGTLDDADNCPNVPGPPSNNGCPIEPPPPGDADGDGVPDAADQCPDVPGPIDRFGCPLPKPPAPADCSTRRDGTPGGDSLVGTALGDAIRGLGGNDTLRGGPGDDCLEGGRGRDKVWGEGGDDEVRGGDGPDVVSGGSGDDVVRGGRGRDRLAGGPGDDLMRAKDHHRDRVRCGAGADRVLANRRDSVAGDCERVKLVGRHR